MTLVQRVRSALVWLANFGMALSAGMIWGFWPAAFVFCCLMWVSLMAVIMAS
jgi:hypothetical protein